MYWGDKGVVEDRISDSMPENGGVLRRAGTDWHPLPAVQFDRMYM